MNAKKHAIPAVLLEPDNAPDLTDELFDRADEFDGDKLQKITLNDFAKNAVLKEHALKSKAVARALDEKADTLPEAVTLPRPCGA